MKIIDIDIDNIQLEEIKNLHLCLGFFDGIHLGHKNLIEQALKHGITGVMTFDIPPHFALGIKTVNACLTSLYDKSNLLEKLGVKYLFVLRMSKELLGLSKEEFINKILKVINPVKIYVGEDYRFGKNAEGTPNYLKKQFDVEIVPLSKINNIKISSKKIGELISNGEINKVKNLLGRNYFLTGLVVHGKGNGTDIGFPTANLELDFPYILPKVGVYYGNVSYLDKKYKALICVSTHPSIMELNSPIIEVHLLYYSGDLYGKEIDVEFCGFVRDIMRFTNLEELKEQISKDIIFAKNALK